MSPRQKSDITVASRAALAGADPDDIIARRLKGDPRATKAGYIPDDALRERGMWDTYIGNDQLPDASGYVMVHRKGWTPLTIDDLAEGITPQSLGFQVKEDGQTLCRGARGDEIVYKMKKEHRAALLRRNTELNMKGIGSAQKVRQDVANAVAGTHGAEAGDFVYKHGDGFGVSGETHDTIRER